jgi:hypothetical protein
LGEATRDHSKSRYFTQEMMVNSDWRFVKEAPERCGVILSQEMSCIVCSSGGGGRVKSQRRQKGTTHVNIVISSTTIVSFFPSRFVGSELESQHFLRVCVASSTSNILNAENASAVGDTCCDARVRLAALSFGARRYFHQRELIEVMKETHSGGALDVFALVGACYAFVCFRCMRI